VVVYELLPGTAELKQLIQTHSTVAQMVTLAQQQGMLSLRQNAIEKVLQGVLDLASARAVAA
jgi:type II secretory ATPase GspE/PulE/Tfp pilus assembly ATPase PilB-like protein